jgi:hypothetical protein
MAVAAGVVLGYIGIILLNVFVLAPFARALAFMGVGV